MKKKLIIGGIIAIVIAVAIWFYLKNKSSVKEYILSSNWKYQDGTEGKQYFESISDDGLIKMNRKFSGAPFTGRLTDENTITATSPEQAGVFVFKRV